LISAPFNCAVYLLRAQRTKSLNACRGVVRKRFGGGLVLGGFLLNLFAFVYIFRQGHNQINLLRFLSVLPLIFGVFDAFLGFL